MAYRRNPSYGRRSGTASSRRRTKNRKPRGQNKALPVVLTAAVVAAAALGIAANYMKNDAKASSHKEQPAKAERSFRPADDVKVEVDSRQFSGGFPSEAEDLYREGHTLLDEAMNAEGGIDSDKLRAALKKLDASVDAYYVLEKKHPDKKVISNRINKINKLRMIARKSYSIPVSR